MDSVSLTMAGEYLADELSDGHAAAVVVRQQDHDHHLSHAAQKLQLPLRVGQVRDQRVHRQGGLAVTAGETGG